MDKSKDTSSSEVALTEVDGVSGVISETLYEQRFAGDRLIFSTQKEYETIEPVDCTFFAQEVELPAVPQQSKTASRSVSRSRSSSPQPSTNTAEPKKKKRMARLKHTLTQKQKAIFLKHGFTQVLADEVLKRKPFPWKIEHIRQYVLGL